MLGALLADKTKDRKNSKRWAARLRAGAIFAPQNLTARRIDSHFFSPRLRQRRQPSRGSQRSGASSKPRSFKGAGQAPRRGPSPTLPWASSHWRTAPAARGGN